MIYLLEDDDSIRKLVTYGLESQGYAARGFARPSEFWRAMDEATPELLLLDIMLPEEDGLCILQRLRSAAATKKLPTPQQMPTIMVQKRYRVSRESLIAVRNRTIDSAPTIPSDRTTLLVTARITIEVIIVSAISVPPKLEEYITPVYVFLYTNEINSPTPNASARHRSMSITETLVTFSRKLDLKISEKEVIMIYPFQK